MPGAKNESWGESAGKYSMGWAQGTHLILGGGQAPEQWTLGPQVSSWPFPVGPGT